VTIRSQLSLHIYCSQFEPSTKIGLYAISPGYCRNYEDRSVDRVVLISENVAKCGADDDAEC